METHAPLRLDDAGSAPIPRSPRRFMARFTHAPAALVRGCLAILIVAVGACGGSTTDSVSYDGDWSGTTSQGLSFGFTVVGNALTQSQMSYNLSGSCSQTPTGQTTTYSTPVAVTGHTFSASGTATISGTFSSGTTASGTFSVSFTGNPPGCNSSASGSWTASR